MDKKLKKLRDRWEEKTSVYVVFGEDYVHLHGDFTVDELRVIASVQAKSLKEKK